MDLSHDSRVQVWRAEIASWHIPIRTLIAALIVFAAVASAMFAILEASPTNFVP